MTSFLSFSFTRPLSPFILAVLLGLFLNPMGIWGYSPNGFDLTNHNIPTKDILSGRPGRDGIPALLKPVFIPAAKATFLTDSDRVLGIGAGVHAKAYPVKILNWHEIVNDRIDGKPIVISYCPLCGTGMGFRGDLDGHMYTFGVSGLLYQSDLLMYDHQTKSLWSQIGMEAVAGPLTGTKLQHIFLDHMTWREWRTRHPDTLVLSKETGYRRDYHRDPYVGYDQHPDLFFPVNHQNNQYSPKEWVLGVVYQGKAKAYPFSEFESGQGKIEDSLNGSKIVIHFNHRALHARITQSDGTPIPSVMAYWFAWYTFHPDTAIFRKQ
jgi:hypothetical protein